MILLPQVTLISLAAIGVEDTIEAMVKSQAGVKFGASKLVTPVRPEFVPKSIQWEQSPMLRLRGPGIDDYSHYCLYNLWRHVDTEFALVVQADGYVINPEMWQESFLEYDYIGAPWPILENAYVDPFGKHQQVGNGGFSLRSRKLMITPQSHHIEWDVNTGDFYKHMNANSLAEDGNICVHNKHVFEAAGCRFAPIQVAVHFAQELSIPESKGVTPFGFHRYKPNSMYLRRSQRTKWNVAHRVKEFFCKKNERF